MRRLPRSAAVAILVPLAMLAACSTTAVQDAAAGTTTMQEPVDLALMTWVELKAAIEAGKTTALIYNGGTETRGPQAVNGGHTLVAHAKNIAIARELGNAIAAPVLPYSPNRANPDLPGTIGLSEDTYRRVNLEIAESLIANGFRNVVIMGDHGGGQKQLAELAAELDARYSPQGIRVVYCDDVYKKSNDDFNAYIASLGLSPGGHASINDTSEMMYLEPAPNAWVRRDQLPNAVGTQRRRDAPPDPDAPPPNGVNGDGRKAAPDIGKVGYELHVSQAVAQIKQLLAHQ